MQPTESAYRETEQRLDAALEDAREALNAAGLVITDHSSRAYHYKANWLCWSQSLTREWDQGIYTAQVVVELQYLEPTDQAGVALVQVSLRAQRFRTGQESVIDHKSKSMVPASSLLSEGMEHVVVRKLREGERVLGNAL